MSAKCSREQRVIGIIPTATRRESAAAPIAGAFIALLTDLVGGRPLETLETKMPEE